MIWRSTTWRLVNAHGHRKSPRGTSGRFPRRSSRFFRSNSPAMTLSSWDAARPTFPRGSRGAEPRVVGIDNSEAQLDTARRLQRQYELEDRALRGRTSSADAALQTAGVAAHRHPTGPGVGTCRSKSKAKNPRGFGGQSHPIPTTQ
jgi:hypothetical protein